MKVQFNNAFFIRTFLFLSIIGMLLKFLGNMSVDNETLTQLLIFSSSLIGLGNLEKFSKKGK